MTRSVLPAPVMEARAGINPFSMPCRLYIALPWGNEGANQLYSSTGICGFGLYCLSLLAGLTLWWSLFRPRDQISWFVDLWWLQGDNSSVRAVDGDMATVSARIAYRGSHSSCRCVCVLLARVWWLVCGVSRVPVRCSMSLRTVITASHNV